MYRNLHSSIDEAKIKYGFVTELIITTKSSKLPVAPAVAAAHCPLSAPFFEPLPAHRR
jgi:hypothetical protein